MSRQYTKLFSSITESTVWAEPLATRAVWITMLAKADRHGRIWASVPGLANLARVTIEETEAALARFMAPDKYSRTPDFEGRRIEVIDGGWRLLNHAKYRELRDEEERRDYKRAWDRTHRKRNPTNPTNPTRSDKNRPRPTHADADAKAGKPSPATAGEGRGAAATMPDCPHERLIDLYHELLQTCPKVVEWNQQRQALMRARWREQSVANGKRPGYSTEAEGLQFWRRYFEYCSTSAFLTGNAEGRNGRPPFIATLEWLIRPKNFANCVEGKYHSEILQVAGRLAL